MVQHEQWRVFCAIDLPEDVRERLMAHANSLRQAVPDTQASWSRPRNIHLTVKFLGEIPQSRVEGLSRAAASATSGLEPFAIRVKNSGVFPTQRAPRVMWIGIEDLRGKLDELHRRLEEECEQEGFIKELRPFHPHLTLARLRRPQHARTLASAHQSMEFEPAEITVSELLVIRSELSSDGSKYSVIARHPMGVSDKL